MWYLCRFIFECYRSQDFDLSKQTERDAEMCPVSWLEGVAELYPGWRAANNCISCYGKN
jgi:hypothetical protein